tara:strand:- start:1152 stop:1523 length:372 start_codon:yes stop_codon:yes gene_type:complete
MINGLIALAIIMGFGLMIDVFDDGVRVQRPRLKHDEINAIFMAFERIETHKNSDILFLIHQHIIGYQQILTLADKMMMNLGTFNRDRLHATNKEIYDLATVWSQHLKDLSHSDIKDYIQTVSA